MSRTIRTLVDHGWIDGIAAMMERRAPALLVAGDLADECEAVSRRRIEVRGEIVRRYQEQLKRGDHDLAEIARALGVSLRTVEYHTFTLRHAKAPRRKTKPRRFARG